MSYPGWNSKFNVSQNKAIKEKHKIVDYDAAFYCLQKQAINALPGPPRTLFFGNTLQMDKHHLPAWIHNQAKTYDEGLMRVSFLSTHSIMLNTWEAENEAYVTRGNYKQACLDS